MSWKRKKTDENGRKELRTLLLYFKVTENEKLKF